MLTVIIIVLVLLPVVFVIIGSFSDRGPRGRRRRAKIWHAPDNTINIPVAL